MTTAALLLSTLSAAALTSWRADLRRDSRLEARWTEAGLVAAAAQRWMDVPSAWGGSGTDSFDGLTAPDLGLGHSSPSRPTAIQTAVGQYRLFPIPARRWSEVAAPGFGGMEAPGLLVIGTGGADEASVAVLALGRMVQIRLPRVPLPTRRAAPEPVVKVPARPARSPRSRPTRHRRTPRPSTQRGPMRTAQPVRS